MNGKGVNIIINGRALAYSKDYTMVIGEAVSTANPSLVWVFKPVAGKAGVYNIQNVASGLFLDVFCAQDNEEQALCGYKENGQANQQFSFENDHIVSQFGSKRVVTLNKNNKGVITTAAKGDKTQIVQLRNVEPTYPIELNIVHFNDVYEIKEFASEPVGGANRFASAVKSFSHLNPMLLFSGDLFNPSMMATITKGKHMVQVMNELKVTCSAVGNHEFDYGPELLTKYIADCNFPWLLSNVVDKFTGQPLVGSITKTIITWGSVRVGLVGLAELEWLEAVANIFSYAAYKDYVTVGKQLVKELQEEGVDIIVALAHMRVPTAVDVAKTIPGIDLILNGHDHFYDVTVENGIHVITSGVDFKNLSVIKCVKKDKNSRYEVTCERVDVTKKFPEDPDMKAITQGFIESANKKMQKVIGQTGVTLDCTCEGVRTKESNAGNLLSDIMRQECGTHIAFFNGGSIRSDAKYGPGPFTIKDLLSILPFTNVVVTIRLRGEILVKLLDAGVGRWPSQVGRFPQVSGMKFEFDGAKPEGSRVDPNSIFVNGAKVNPKQLYTVATTLFIAQGNDGYNCLNGAIDFITNEETGLDLSTLVRKYFIQMRTAGIIGAKSTKDPVRKAFNKWKSYSKKIQHQAAPFTVSPVEEGRIKMVTRA